MFTIPKEDTGVLTIYVISKADKGIQLYLRIVSYDSDLSLFSRCHAGLQVNVYTPTNALDNGYGPENSV